MAMNPRLLRPLASGAALHPEVQDWIARVTTAGGTASTSTLRAMSQFCAAIDAAGLRSLLARVNLFCGGSLTAALVPLYTSTSFGGAVTGNATDTNNGPFVTADFAENEGLLGADLKWLDTGVPANFTAKRHLSVTTQTASANSFRRLIGIDFVDTSSSNIFQITVSSPPTLVYAIAADGTTLRNTGVTSAYNITGGDCLMLSVVGTTATFYADGAAQTPTTTVSDPDATRPFAVFAQATDSGASSFYTGKLSSYSIGLGMTATQAAAYSAIIRSFNSSIGRA